MRAIPTFLCATLAFAAQQQAILGPPVLPDVLSTLLEAYKPLLTNYARSELPATIGNCKEENAPKPCSEAGNLYEDKNTFYNVKARWVSGLNTMRVDNITIAFDDTGAMTLNMKANFAQLPTSLLVQGCGGVLGCLTVLDNTKSCCGTDKNVEMTATAKCSETYPYVTNLTLSQAKITPAINVEVDVFGKPFKVADVTPSIERGLRDAAGNFLSTKGLELFNNQIKSLFGDKIYCSQKSKDAQTPAPTTTTVAPTPAPTNATTASPKATDSSSSSTGTSTPSDNPPTPSSPVATSSASAMSVGHLAALVLALFLVQ